jgi:DNA-binding MarR family transcriptional regulator
MTLADSGVSADTALERFGRLMRALHVARAARGVPWADCPLTLVQLRALGLLAARPRGISGRDLAALLGVGPSAVTPLADRLVEHGLARREEDPVDRRITRLIATDAGLAVLDRMVAGQREHMREVLAHLSPDELAIVDRAFGLLYEGVRRICANDESPAAAAS